MIKFYSPARQARPGPPLSPILGQHQVKVADFVTEFNARSAQYTEGVPLGCRVSKQGSRFTLQVRPPTVHTLLTSVDTPATRVWAALQLRAGPAGPTPTAARSVLGSARSGRRPLTRG